jgi:hypothetical protein
VSSNYTCVQGHEQDATNKLQDYLKRAITNFFKSRRIAIDPSTLQINVSLTIQTGTAMKPYVAFTGNAASGFAANPGAGALGAPGGAAATPGTGAAAIPGGGAAGIPSAAVKPGAGGAATALGGATGGATGYAAGGGLGGSSVAATVTAKDGTRFDVFFSSGSDTQDAGEYRIIATQRGFSREGNPIDRHCRLRLFESGDFDATRRLLVINAGSGHVLGLIPLPSEVRLY